MNAKIKVIIILVVVCVFAISCKHSDEHKYHTVKDKIEAKTIEYTGELSSEIYNETIEKVVVDDGGFQFLIPERKSQIASYNCTECHSESLEKLSKHKVGEKAAHWNIKLNHAGTEIMNCTTCHNQKDLKPL